MFKFVSLKPNAIHAHLAIAKEKPKPKKKIV
jgi:hypothetical protein